MEIKPSVCCLSITDKCMLRCKMCNMWKGNTANLGFSEIDIRYWQSFLVALNKFTGNAMCINFVGGESLMSGKTLDIIKYASNLGFVTALASNGYMINNEMAKKIADSSLKEIALSLDSLNEETHDFLRGAKGAFRRIINAIEYLYKEARCTQIKINTVIMERNLQDIVDLAKWAIGDSRIVCVNFQAITQPFNMKPEDKWYEKDEYRALWPNDLNKVEDVMEELIKLKQENKRKINNPASQFRIYKAYFKNPQSFIKGNGCHLYKQAINIDSNDQIFICYNYDPIANIKQESLDIKELFCSAQADLVRNNIKNCKKNCQEMINCYYDESEHYIS